MGLDVTNLRSWRPVALRGPGAAGRLEQLTRLPLDILKLDRSLITRIDRDPKSRALAESMIGIGRALGLDVVAEGVENPAQLAACGPSAATSPRASTSPGRRPDRADRPARGGRRALARLGRLALSSAVPSLAHGVHIVRRVC